MSFLNKSFRLGLFAATALAGAALHAEASAQTTATAGATASPSTNGDIIVTLSKTTRSAVLLSGVETQKLLPGMNPLKAIETLPGVVFETADPWGNNEQNEVLFVHGFSTQQLGYTMDGVPLGDQQYGNYNGLSPSRALTSENVDRVNLSSGAGVLGVASTSNLGGAIETYSIDPSHSAGGDIRETLGSYDANRTFLRLDTGDFDDGRAFVSYLHQDARAWDFDGHQRGDQVNLKYVHDDARGKLTLYGDWQSKVEPNEDAISYGAAQTAPKGDTPFIPYTRPFLYPNLSACASDLTNGAPPASQGNNFSNCFSAAQRSDVLTYAKYDYRITPDITWSNQVYYHYDYGRGIVAGPINQAGLPALFATYYPSLVVGGSSSSAGSLANLVKLFGGTGDEVRTTEYRINREGYESNLNWRLGQHDIEAGLWWEHDEDAQHRVWYPFSAANNDLTPYDIPDGQSVLTQYYAQFFVNDVQLHLQDQWRILPSLLLQAGFKSSLQDAEGKFPVNQENLPSVAVPVHYPSGTIISNNGFLPQVGGVWDVTEHEQVFANVQENMRQTIPYGAGSGFNAYSPWSLGTQAAFNLFKATVHPETSWTYEIGGRSHQSLELGPLTGIDGQASFYHVDFYNRLLNVAPVIGDGINPGPSILVNVGGVTTNGADFAATLHFGHHFQIYDTVSYNKTTYNSDYTSGGVTEDTAGKWVPLEPDWLEKFIISGNYGGFEGQVSGDYVGRRYVTYLNDLSVNPTFLLGLEASYKFPISAGGPLKTTKLSFNVTNLADTKGVSTAVVTGLSGGYQAYPLAPRMVFATLQATF
jgi:hypothetical protein